LHDHSYSTAYAASIPTLFANNSMDTLMICDQGTASSLAIANNVHELEEFVNLYRGPYFVWRNAAVGEPTIGCDQFLIASSLQTTYEQFCPVFS
ncbi:hypothetical protein K0M31_011102, partial [Melipona bicolor]